MNANLLFGIAYKLAPYFLQKVQPRAKVQYKVLSDKDEALLRLKRKDGAVILILGKRESGKTILSHRLAMFLDRTTYAVTPNQRPPDWITKIELDDIEEVPPNSIILLDDVPVYMSSRDYNDAKVRSIEKLIPVARHKKIMLIFISQTSGFADRWVMDADAIFLKQSSILYADIERPAVKKLIDKAAPHFEGQSEYWAKRHCYLITDSWEGMLEVRKAG